MEKRDDKFIKIWSNIVLRRIIVSHLRVYRQYNRKVYIAGRDKLLQHPNRDYIKYLALNYSHDSNVVKQVGDIPSDVEYLNFSRDLTDIQESPSIDTTIKVGFIPSSVTSLFYNYMGKEPLEPLIIPSSVTELQFGFHFNQVLVKDSIPSNCKSLKFGNCFNQSISNQVIPRSVEHLEFGNDFNLPLAIGDIPSSVTTLIFGYRFNQAINDGVLDGIQTIEFGFSFNQSQVSIPSSCINLSFIKLSPNTISSLKIPPSVEELEINYNFAPLEPGTIPNSIRNLTLHSDKPIRPNDLPSSIHTLIFYGGLNYPLQVGSLPPSITILKMPEMFNQVIYRSVLPVNLKVLELGNFNRVIKSLPSRLEILKFGRNFNQIIKKNVLPLSLQSIQFSDRFNHPLKSVLPSKLKSCTLGLDFNQQLKQGDIPLSVEILEINSGFKHQLSSKSIPSNVKYLTLNCNHSLQNILPTNLVKLTLGPKFDQPLQQSDLPINLKVLKVHSNYYKNNHKKDILTIINNNNNNLKITKYK